MEQKNLDHYVSVYRKLLDAGDVQIAYTGLVKYVQKLRTDFSKRFKNEYTVGNVFQGYMDYSYFYLSNDDLKAKKLKLALVLNHTAMRFEIWLLGQTKDVQKKYFERLQNTKWIKTKNIPEYPVFEVVLVKEPKFNNLEPLANLLMEAFSAVAGEITESLK